MFHRKKEKGTHKWLIGGFALTLLLVGCASFLLHKYTVTNVYVKGNVHYTPEEIEEIVMSGPLGNNSLYLSFKYRDKGVKDIPFVDAMDVNILSPDTIEIYVYEKALAGFVKSMDTYVYFDKDGYVVECSNLITDGVPQVTGLTFDHIVLGEQLPVEDEEIFHSIMDLTKLLDKYDLDADKIYFHSSDEVTIYFGNVKVALGSDRMQLENKLMRLPQLLAKVDGKAGTLRMESLTEDKTDVTFQEAKQ